MRLYHLLLALFLLALAAPVYAEDRVALVIGNGAYTGLASLDNPGADAAELAKTLGQAGFDVISCDGKRPGCFDLTQDGLKNAIGLLKAKSAGASLAFVFYAGHGLDSGGGNMLVPVDASVDCATYQLSRGILLDEVLEALDGAKQKVIVLDACRDNPLGQIARRPPRPPSSRSAISKSPTRAISYCSARPSQARLRSTACRASIRPSPALCSPASARLRRCISIRSSTRSPRP